MDQLIHDVLEIPDVLRLGALRVGGRLQDGVVLAFAQALEDGCSAVGAERPSQELANHGDGAAVLEHECR